MVVLKTWTPNAENLDFLSLQFFKKNLKSVKNGIISPMKNTISTEISDVPSQKDGTFKYDQNGTGTDGDSQVTLKAHRKTRIKYDQNPFLREVVATLGDKRVAVSMKSNLGELDPKTGVYQPIPGQITKLISADRESFVKLYTAQIDAFFELGKPGRSVIKYLIWLHQREANRHLFILHLSQVKESSYEISRSSWFAGISELLDKKIIAASTATNGYYLNAAVFFNGDRTRFVTEVTRQKAEEEKTQLEIESLQRKISQL